jgi:predicted ATPase/DNA-binding CsgD family transcriptional regulator
MARSVTDRRFVGRDDELVALESCFERAAHNETTLVAVSGEAGIGKSRLVREFAQRVESRANGIGTGHCLEHLRTPFLPFGEVLRGLGVETRASASGATEAPRGRAQSEKHLRRLQELSHALLGAGLSTPRIVIIEDVHWADAATLGLLEHIAISRSDDPLMIILTVRSEAVERGGVFARALSRLRSEGLTSIALPPLQPSQMAAFLRGAAPARLSRATIERIKERAEGNPLFAEELLRGALEQGEGTLLLPAYASIRATVADRLYQLDEADQRALVCAAAIGRFFDVRLVATLTDRPLEHILEAMRRARSLQLIREVPGAAPDLLAFRHEVFSEVVYGELLTAEARELHSRVAKILEQGTDANRRKAEIAYHWSASGNREKALICNAAAGDDAMTQTAFEDAARFYEEALRHVEPRTVAAAELAEKRAYAWYAAGVAEDTGALFSEALEAYDALGNRQKVVEMLLFLSRQAWNDAQTPDGYRHAMRAIELIGEQEASLRDYAQTMAATYAAHLGQVDEAERILGECRENANPRLNARATDVRAILRARRGEVLGAISLCHGAQEIARQSGDPDVVVRVFSNSADIYAISERHGEAAALWREAYVAAQTAGYIGRMAYAALGYAASLIDRGEIASARELFEVAVETGVTNASVMIQAAAVGALLQALLGVAAPAFVDEQNAFELALRSKESLRIGQLGAALSFARIVEGRLDEARNVLERAIATLESPAFATMLLLLGRAYGTPETQERARQLFEQILRREELAVASICYRAASALGGTATKRRAQLCALAAEAAELKHALLQMFLLHCSGEKIKVRELALAAGAAPFAERLETTRRKRSSPASVFLTSRELEIARLIAEEESNRGIAELLGISERTVEHHVASILSRLGVRSRWLITPELIARSQS